MTAIVGLCGRCLDILSQEDEMDKLALTMEHLDFDDYLEAQLIYRAMAEHLSELEHIRCHCDLVNNVS